MRIPKYHCHPAPAVRRAFLPLRKLYRQEGLKIADKLYPPGTASPKAIFLPGFTLVEVLLAVVILSVIAGLAVPNFSRSYRQFRLKKAAGDLAYVMRYAQSRAVVKNRQVKLEFDSEFSGYRLWEEIAAGTGEIENGSASGDTGRFREMPGRFGKVFKIPEGLKVEGDVSIISFYPDGRMDRQRFYICDKDGCFTVSTKEQRGHVRTFKGKPDE